MGTRIRAALISVVAASLLAGCDDAGTTITRLAVGDPGPDAYTLAAGTDDGEVTRRAQAGGTLPADAPGLYGGSRKTAGCDKDALVGFLRTSPDKARAWAGALGIDPAGIGGFVAALTPVVLRADTLVTNHGYRDGRATSLPAVLQAGVGVLVDEKGLPVVKCNCGNPLTAPDESVEMEGSEFRGREWPEFDPDKVTVVQPSDGKVKSLVLVDPETDDAFERPVGTEGEADGSPMPVPPSAAPEPEAGPDDPTAPSDGPVPSPAPQPTKKKDEEAPEPGGTSVPDPVETEQTPETAPKLLPDLGEAEPDPEPAPEAEPEPEAPAAQPEPSATQ